MFRLIPVFQWLRFSPFPAANLSINRHAHGVKSVGKGGLIVGNAPYSGVFAASVCGL
jgi:hypothetical protein